MWSWLLASFWVRDRKYLSVGFIFRISEATLMVLRVCMVKIWADFGSAQNIQLPHGFFARTELLQCCSFFWGLLQMFYCFICLSKSGVRDDGKRFVERQRAKRSMATLRWISLMNFCKLTVSFFLALRAKPLQKNIQVFFWQFFHRFRKFDATRSSRPFSDIR